MMEWRAAVAPFLESIRTGHTTPQTVKAYTDRLNTAIDFLEHRGGCAPADDYYAALEENLLSLGLAASTVKSRINLARRFFTWAAAQEGDIQIPMNNWIQTSNEEAPARDFALKEAGTVQEKSGVSSVEPAIPPLSSVEASQSPEPVPAPPQEEEEEEEERHRFTGRPRKSPEGRSRKLTLYLTPALDDDVKDLARIQRLSTPDYIFRLIERERDRRAQALEAFRALEED